MLQRASPLHLAFAVWGTSGLIGNLFVLYNYFDRVPLDWFLTMILCNVDFLLLGITLHIYKLILMPIPRSLQFLTGFFIGLLIAQVVF